MNSVKLLMYHRIIDSESSREALPEEDRFYAITKDVFASHIDELIKRRVVSLDSVDVADGDVVVLTFDDTTIEHISLAAPMLREARLPAIFFLSSELIGTPGGISVSQVRQLVEDGFLVGAHGHSHFDLTNFTQEELDEQLLQSFSRIDMITSEATEWMSLPFGKGWHRELAAALSVGFKGVATSEVGIIKSGDDNENMSGLLPRILIHHKTDAASLIKILDGDLAEIKRRKEATKKAKKIMGLWLYEKIKGLM